MIMMGFEDTVLCTGVPSFVVAILIIITLQVNVFGRVVFEAICRICILIIFIVYISEFWEEDISCIVFITRTCLYRYLIILLARVL